MFAISSTCSRVTEPTTSLPTWPAPFPPPAAFLTSPAAGVYFSIQSKLLSLYTETSPALIFPAPPPVALSYPLN